MRESVKIIQRFVNASAWHDYVIGPYGDFADATTDEAIENYMRQNSATFFHPISTAMMSPKGASWGVVDPNLKVKHVEGLRIVDGSVLVSCVLQSFELVFTRVGQPFLPNAHTQAPIFLISERGADLIKADNPVFN